MLNKKYNPVKLLFIISVYTIFLFTQSIFAVETARFEHYSTENGLSNDEILDVYQDKNGFIWMATWSGLSRFDGYRFKNYYKNNKSSLSHNRVTAINGDSQGNLWVGTNAGVLNYFNTHQQLFKYYNLTDPDINNGYSIHHIYSVDDNHLWITTYDNGLYRLNIDTNTFKIYKHNAYLKDTLGEYAINNLFVSHDDVLWAPANEGGFHKLSLISEQFGLQRAMIGQNILIDYPIEKIYEDSNGYLWLL